MTDGNLPLARRRLENAISALIDPKPVTRHHDNGPRIEWCPSLLRQLAEAVPGTQGTRRAVPASSPPLNLDAVELLAEIDTTVSAWEPRRHHPTEATFLRLRAIQARLWRPQDTAGIDQITRILRQWAQQITELLNPTTTWTLPAPCPACGTQTVYRHNSAGETVRHPALTITTDGCECLKCHATWSPQLFVHLSRVLGTLQPGVLD